MQVLTRWVNRGRLLGSLLWAVNGGLVTVARADDAAMTSGGAPRLMTGHPHIRMVDEVIRIHIGAKRIDYDCRFEFQNAGPAATVRIGFPDQGFGAEETEASSADEAHPKASPAYSGLSNFRSYVNGRVVPTRLERGEASARSWHTKRVTFRAYGRVLIRNTFSTAVGGGATMRGYVRQARYVIHTGASWHGNIGHARVEFTFPKPTYGRAVLINGQTLMDDSPGSDSRLPFDGWRPGVPQIVAHGFAPARAVGNRVIFERRNFRPSRRDDVAVDYDFMPAPK